MLINATAANELRIAIVEDGELVELDIEAAEQSSIRYNIYKGVVHNVEGSLEAAFIDIGSHKQGFLPFSEVSPSQYFRKANSDQSPRITDVLRRGQDIIVQVAKDAVGEKGATLTTFLSIPGRYSVLMPGSEANGISRKIEDDKMRKRIRAMASKLDKPEGCGFIIRTAGLGQTRAAIQRDLNQVAEIWDKVRKASEIARAPSVLYTEPDLVARTLRDYYTEEIDEVWIDTREEYDAAKAYFEDLMPAVAERVQLYENPIPIFAYHHVEEQIEATFHRRVPLPSGGSIVIDETEALVAIDVNSGKMTSERDHEETVFKTNCEAAEEAARQLKLRDLGGIVVVDFIDMELSKNKREVETAMSEAAAQDKARYKNLAHQLEGPPGADPAADPTGDAEGLPAALRGLRWHRLAPDRRVALAVAGAAGRDPARAGRRRRGPGGDPPGLRRVSGEPAQERAGRARAPVSVPDRHQGATGDGPRDRRGQLPVSR